MFKDTDDDLSVYKDCFMDLLGDDTLKLMKIVNANLPTILFNYVNNHGAKSPKSENSKKDDDNPF
jgi:hypothetical protein